jgi:hypothetical protein
VIYLPAWTLQRVTNGHRSVAKRETMVQTDTTLGFSFSGCFTLKFRRSIGWTA